MNKRARDRPGRPQLARVQPGIVLDHLRDAAEKHRPHLRPRPRHAQPLHPRRHDRQQLLRRPRADGRQDRRQHRSARHPALRRHPHDRRPHHRGRARARSSPPAAASARSTPSSRRLRDNYADARPRALPAESPAASPATTSTTSCPKTASTSPAPSSAREGTCVTILEATLQPGAEPAVPPLSSASASRHLHRRRPRPGDPRAQAHRPRRHGRPSSSTTC